MAAPEAPRALPGTDRVPPAMLLLAGIMSIQFGAAFAVTLFDELGASGTSLLRIATAATLLLLIWRPRVRELHADQWRAVVPFGVILGLMNLTFYEALARMPIGPTVTIEFLGPLAVAIAAARRRLDIVVALLAMGGVVLLTEPWGAGGFDTVGLLFAAAAGVCWGTYVIVAQRASGQFHGSDGVAIAMAIAVLVPLGPGIAQAGPDLLDPRLLALGAVVGIASSLVPYSLETEALRRLPARVFSILLSLEPAVAALAGLLVLGQHLDPVQLLGIALVVAASISVTRGPVAEA